jgi:hypothetical protein
MEDYLQHCTQFHPPNADNLKFGIVNLPSSLNKKMLDSFRVNSSTKCQQIDASNVHNEQNEDNRNSNNPTAFKNSFNYESSNISETLSSSLNIDKRISTRFDEIHSSKPYFCSYSGCFKRYKNANGLKYHLVNWHGEAQNPITSGAENSIEIHPQYRRYYCAFNECQKKYKTINGLRYHLQTLHLDLDQDTITAILKSAKEAGDRGVGSIYDL